MLEGETSLICDKKLWPISYDVNWYGRGKYLSVSTPVKVGSPEFSHQGSMDTGFLRRTCGANEA